MVGGKLSWSQNLRFDYFSSYKKKKKTTNNHKIIFIKLTDIVFTVFKLEQTANMLCEVALPVGLFCINYSIIKKGSLYCNQLPGVLKQEQGP